LRAVFQHFKHLRFLSTGPAHKKHMKTLVSDLPQSIVEMTLSPDSEESPEDRAVEEEHNMNEKKARNEKRTVPLWHVVLAAGGASLYDMYDFTVYGYCAPYIATNFFPQGGGNINLALLESFATYSAAFFMRPVGAAYFGYVGDMHGRRRALIQSTLLMAIPSFFMGFLPTYKQVGTPATLLLVLLRMMQGIAVGGQLSGAYIIMVETAPVNRRAYYGSMITAANSIGSTCGSAVVTLLTLPLSQSQMNSWGWRIPFILGSLFGPFGLIVLRLVPNQPTITSHCSTKIAKNNNVLERLRSIVWGSERSRLYIMTGCLAGTAGAAYFKVWMLSYLATLTTIMSYHKASLISTCTLALEILLFPCFGWLADKIAEEKGLEPFQMHARFIEFSALSAGAFSLLMFWWMGRDRRFYVIAIAQTAWSVIIAIGSSCVAAFEVVSLLVCYFVIS